ncbi:phosphatase PAP2 family protein [Chloroflexota bacterium]
MHGQIMGNFQRPSSEIRKQVANLTSNVLSPSLIGLSLILVVSFEATDSLFDATRWALILTAINVLPAFLFAVYLARHDRLDSVFAIARESRTQLYALGVILSGASCVILLSLKAPLILSASFVATFAVNIIFMCVNLWWKISLHTAFITAAVAILFILYGFVAIASMVLVPLVAWSRVELEHHSPAQVITGGLLTISIVPIVFYLFGLI